MQSSRLQDRLSRMKDATSLIADKVRGVAAEHHLTQQGLAEIIGRDRKSVHERWHGRVPFSAAEVFAIATATGETVSRFFPEPITDAPRAA